MSGQDTRTTTTPAWFNLDVLMTAEAVAELNDLADAVERFVIDFQGLLGERCFRALLAAEKAGRSMDMGDEGYELIRRCSGAGRLHDALYALTGNVEAANRENPNNPPTWLESVRAELASRSRTLATRSRPSQP